MQIYLNFTEEETKKIIDAHTLWAGKGSKSINKFIKFAALEMAGKIMVAEFEAIKKNLKE